MDVFSKDNAEKVVTKTLDVVEMAGEVAAAKGEIVSNFSEMPGMVLSGVGVAGGAVKTVRGAIETGTELKTLGSALLQKKDLKDVKKNDTIRELLEEREHCSAVMMIHQSVALKSAEKVASNTEMIINLDAGINDLSKGFTDVEKAEARRQIEKLNLANAELLEGIAKLQAGVAGVDARITEINLRPEIAQLRLLEAKVDLANEVLKDKTKSLRSMMATAETGIGTATDAAQLVLGVVQAAAPAAQVVATGAAIAGPAISVGVSALGVAANTASMVLDVREAMQLSKMSKNAEGARNIAAQQGNDQLEAAFKRVQMQADQMKTVKKVEVARDVTGIVAGSAAAVAGSALLATAIAGAASAPGFGAGAVAPAVVTVAATTVTVGAAAVCIGAEMGVQLTKKGIEHRNEKIAKESNLAISGLDKLVALAKDPNAQTQGQLPLTMKEQEAIKKLQTRAIIKDHLSEEDAGDLAKLRNYAECRVISRENIKALEVISKELMWECLEPMLKRKGTSLVQADLPNGGPAVEGLRKLGISDRDIVGLANATSHLDTRAIATKNLAAKTGLSN